MVEEEEEETRSASTSIHIAYYKKLYSEAIENCVIGPPSVFAKTKAREIK